MSKPTMAEILKRIFENGRVTSTSSQGELVNEFEFEARERGWTEIEINEATESDWFPIQT